MMFFQGSHLWFQILKCDIANSREDFTKNMGQPNTEDPPDLKTTLSALGERLSTGKARQAWRSLAELAETPEFYRR